MTARHADRAACKHRGHRGHKEHREERELGWQISCQSHSWVDVFYKGRKVGRFRADFVVEDLVLLEVKAVEALAALHSSQVVTYLRVTRLKLGLLINFNVRLLKEGIRRIAN